MRWFYWIEFVFGIWLLASPWILGYWRVTSALWSEIVIGAALVLLAIWRLAGVNGDSTERSGKNELK